MANFFIAVGGTGQNVALAYHKLAALAGLEPAATYVLDSDPSISINAASFLPLDPIPRQPCVDAFQRNSFRDLFNPRADQNVASVLATFFDKSELDTPIERGMFGHPPVGACAIMDKLALLDQAEPGTECATSDPNLVNLLNTLANGAQHRVVVCGSAMGGTGAGGVPAIAAYIRTRLAAARVRDSVKIVLFYFLDFFRVQPPTARLRLPLIQPGALERNAKSGICYLADKIAKDADACILFGLEEPINIEYREAQAQKPTNTSLYLIAAVMANNTFNCRTVADLFPAHEDRLYSYWIDCDNEQRSLLKCSDVPVFLPNGSQVSLDKVVRHGLWVKTWLDLFHKYITPLPGFSFCPPLAVPPKLRRVLEPWQRKNLQLVNELRERLVRATEDLDTVLRWVEDILVEDSNLVPNAPKAAVFSAGEAENWRSFRNESRPEGNTAKLMRFMRKWIAETNWGGQVASIDEFLNPLRVGLRRAIDRYLMEQAFGQDMPFVP